MDIVDCGFDTHVCRHLDWSVDIQQTEDYSEGLAMDVVGLSVYRIGLPLGQLVKLFAGGIDERLSAYIAYGDSGYAAELGILTNINVLKSLAVATVLLFFSNRLKQMSKYFIFMLYAYIIGVCWMMLFNDFAIIGARISNILLCVEPVLISYLVVLLSKKSRPVFVAILVLLTLTMLTLNIGPDKITPYQFYFA